MLYSSFAFLALYCSLFPQTADPSDSAKRGEATGELQALVEQATAELAELGFELDPARVALERADEQRLREIALDQLETLMPPERLRMKSDLLHGFGFWLHDDEHQLIRLQAQGFGRFAFGFYTPRDRALALRDDDVWDWTTGFGPLDIVVHELVHGWRDQRSGLVESLRGGDPSTDELGIRHFLIEGEAQFAMFATKAARRGGRLEDLAVGEQGIALAIASRADSALAPYVEGARYMADRWREGGWPAVRSALDEPPASMEALLHSSKRGVDEPCVVTLPEWPSALAPAERIDGDTLGERTIRDLARACDLSPLDASLTAAGWDGDRIERYRTASGEDALIWRTVWDRELDARQFYESFARAGDGEWRVDGRVVDWVRTVDGELAAPLLAALAQHPFDGEPGPRDAETTATVEAAMRVEAAQQPFEADGRWVLPAGNCSLPILDGWEPGDLNGVPVLTPPGMVAMSPFLLTTRHPEFGGGLDALERDYRRIAERDASGATTISRRTLDGRPALALVTWSSTGQGILNQTVVTFLEGGHQVLLVFTSPRSLGEQDGRVVDELLDGLRFGIEGVERPPAEPEPEREWLGPPPGPTQHATVRLVNGLTGDPLAGTELWIAPTDAVGRSPKLEFKERDLPRRGRRYRTDDDGRARVAFRSRFQWGFARAGTLVASSDCVLDAGDVEEIRAFPPGDLTVRVVDEAGEPVKGVPVGILHVGRYRNELRELRRSRMRTGEARWTQVFSELATWFGDPEDQYYVTFAFPVADPPRIPIRPDMDLDEPIVLTLPPTGEVVLRLDPESIELDPTDRTYDDGRKMYGPELLLTGDSWEVGYEKVDAVQPGEFRRDERTVFHPFVGLDLELEAVPWGYDYRSHAFHGPTRAGERVEVTLRPHELFGEEAEVRRGESAPSDAPSPALADRLTFVDEAGAPIPDVHCQIVIECDGSGAESRRWTAWEATSDASGRLSLGLEALAALPEFGSVFEEGTARFWIRAQAVGYRRLERVELDPQAHEATLVLVAEATSRIEGRFLLPPRVLESAVPARPYLRVAATAVGDPSTEVGIAEASLDELGLAFSVRALAPGRYDLHLLSSPFTNSTSMGFARAVSGSPSKWEGCGAPLEVDATSAGRTVLGDLPVERPRVLTASVEALDGAPLGPGEIVEIELYGSTFELRVAEAGRLSLLSPEGRLHASPSVRTPGGDDLGRLDLLADLEGFSGPASIRIRLESVPEIPAEQGHLEFELRSRPPKDEPNGAATSVVSWPLCHIGPFRVVDSGVEVELPFTGRWELRWYAARGEGETVRRRRVLRAGDRTIEVAPGDERQEFEVEPPTLGRIERALRSIHD